MTELAQWAGFQFYIAADSALLFDKLKMSAEMETEEQEDQGQKYAASKAGKPVEISLNVILNASLGIDVQSACMVFLDAAKTGQHGYFYMAGQRLLPFEIMMTKASTDEIKMAPGGRWIAANISVTFVQSENGTILGGVIGRQEAAAGGGGGGGSSRNGFLQPLIDAVQNGTVNEYLSLGSAWVAEHGSGTTGSTRDKLNALTGQSSGNNNPVTINARTVAGGIASAAKPASSGVTQSPASNSVRTAVSAVGNAASSLFSNLAAGIQKLAKK